MTLAARDWLRSHATLNMMATHRGVGLLFVAARQSAKGGGGERADGLDWIGILPGKPGNVNPGSRTPG